MKSHSLYVFVLALFLSLAALAVSGLVASANPGIIRVTVNGATSGTCGDQTNWSNPCGLQYALASVAISGDELWVASGTYTPTTTSDRTATFRLRNGITLYGGFAMTETLLSQRNYTANVTILSGDIGALGDSSDNSYHVVTGGGTGSTAALDGFTVMGGNANGTGSDRVGGAMYNSSGSPTLTNVTFSGNVATQGGGMFNSSGSPMLTNVTFSGNSATQGGGMFTASGSPTLTNVTFSGNSATQGGGMHNYINSSPTLTNVIFSGNSATYGGGMANENNSSPTLRNVTFSGNSASFGGGMVDSSSSPMLTNVTFSGNSASYGGGMVDSSSSPTLTNVTFSGNNASFQGGGMHTNNSSPTIRNAILWGNTALAGSQIYNSGSGSTSVSDSVVQGGYGGTNIITTDPLLGALGGWGGATATIPLLPGSSAIDAGNDATCSASDQRGVARPQGAHCDMGAYESRGFTFAQSGNNQMAPINTPFASALSVNISSAYSEPVDGGVMVFTAPSSGASTNPISRTVTIAGGATSASFSANGTLGAYAVDATTGNLTFPFNLANEKGNTTTTIASSENPALGVHTLTFTVTVTSPSGTPSGTVDLYETISPSAASGGATRHLLAAGQRLVPGRSQIPGRPQVPGQPQGSPLQDGIATFSVLSLGVGTHNLLALYSGDASYEVSISAIYTQVVNGLNYYLPLLVR